MQSAFIITDRTQKPYAVVALMPGGTEIYPMTDAASEWASWMADEFATRKITKDELIVTIDNSMDVEGPLQNNRANKARLEELIRQAKKLPKPMSDKPEEKHDDIEMLSLADVILSDLSNDEWRNAVQFKAASFIADTNKSTFAYEVKRTRAMWDPSLSIPGTNRRGGWRCPVGTRYGGQITDRFGRNCGWGAARRLANAISDLGERLENVGDRRREGRVARRNERMVRRLREGGAIERGARAIARGLEGFEFNPENKPMARRRRGELGGARGRRGGMLERAAGRIADVLGEDTQPPRRPRNGSLNLPGGGQGIITPRAPRRPRGGNLRPSEARRIERELERPGAPRTPRPVRPQGPPPGGFRQPGLLEDRDKLRQVEIAAYEDAKRRARLNRPDNVSDDEWNDYLKYLDDHKPITKPNDNLLENYRFDQFDEWKKRQPNKPQAAEKPSMRNTKPPAGGPNPGESLAAYKRRKYNEHQANVRKIREEGGNAGFLKYDEWDAFHGPVVEDNWRKGQGKGRAQRRASADNVAKPKATRRPKADDKPIDKQPPNKNPRKPFKAENARGFNDEIGAKRARNKLERENAEGDFRIVKHNDKYFVVRKEEIDKANANGANLEVVQEPPRPARRPPAPDKAPTPANNQPPQPPKPPQPPAPAGGGTVPSDNTSEYLPLELRPPRKPRNTGDQQYYKVNDAIKHLHQNGGKLEDIPDGVVVEAVLDDNIKGIDITDRQVLLNRGFADAGLSKGDKFENDRYNFELVKKTGRGQHGIWEVLRVKDKKTGETWYLKTSQYGQNDALLENIGMRAAQALEFGNDENHLRIGDQVRGMKPGKRARWMMMRDVKEWDDGVKAAKGEKWKDAAAFLGDKTKLEPRDAARLAVMDFVFDNRDRHGGNFLLVTDDQGRVRIGVIDNGLFGGGRLNETNGGAATANDFDQYAQQAANVGVREYGQKFNNGINGLRNVGFRHRDQRSRQLFAAQAEKAISRLEEQLDNIFDVNRIEANGLKLSDVEKAHMNALRRVVEGRIKKLRAGELDQLVQVFN